MRAGIFRLGIVGTPAGADMLVRRLEGLPAAEAWIVTKADSQAGRARLREVLAQGELVLSCFEGDEEFAAGLGDENKGPALPSGARLVDFSPVTPGAFRHVAAMLSGAGTHLFGATIVKGAADPEDWLIAADDDLLSQPDLREIIEMLARTVVPMGQSGNSKVAGLMERYLNAVSAAVSAEAVSLGRSAGIAPSALIPLLLKGSGATAILGRARSGRTGGDDELQSLAELGLVPAGRLAREVRHPAWFGAVAAEAFRLVCPAGGTGAFERLLAPRCEEVAA